MEKRFREPSYEALLEDMAWCGRLAHRLTRGRDPWDEDALQEAWVLALRVRPPAPLSAARLRAWFHRLAWNRLRERRRSEASRAARERTVSRPEAQESVLDLLERSEAQRRLHEAVMALADPYRSTLLSRYFDGLTSVQIAERDGVSADAVRKRLSRAIEELRGRLDREYGGRRRWLSALAPLASPFEPETGAALENGPVEAVLGTPLGAGLAVGFLALAVALWVATGDGRSREELEAVRVAEAVRDELPSRHARSEEVRDRGSRRHPVVEPGSTSTTDVEPDLGASIPHVRGRVIDGEGRALGSVALRALRASSPRASVRTTTSAADGTFTFPAVPTFDRIVADDPSFATVLAGAGRSSAEAEVLVVLAPALTLTGRVVDEEGRPLARARIQVRSRGAFGADIAASLDHSIAMDHATRTDGDGTFRLEGVPGHEDARLIVESIGYRRLARRVHRTEGFELVLRREALPPDALRGLVLGPDGMPLDGVLVSDGTHSTRTVRGGSFALPASTREGARLVAVHPRFRTLFQTLPPSAGTDAEAPPIELHFGADAPRSLAGLVVDAHGAPVAGARVWIADPTPFGPYEGATAFVESLHVDVDPPVWHWVESDARGRFRLDGLTDRPYRVAAIDARTLRKGDVREGELDGEVLIRLSGEVCTNVTGRIVDDRGRPVPGAAITPARRTLDFRAGSIERFDELSLPTVHTDGDGRFVIPSVAATGVTLCVEGGGVHAFGEELDAHDPDLVITMRPRTHLQVVVPTGEADAFGVLDENEQARELWIVRGRRVRVVQRAAIVEGCSHRWIVDERAATLVLFRDGSEIRRAALSLTSGTLNRVAF